MFLVFVDECQRHHGVIPIDRGQHGLQFRFPYISPNEKEHYGTLSLTFYPTTSRLLVQGSSYMLWVEEHLPIVYKAVEGKYLADIPTWRAQSLRRGIGVRRNRRDGRHVSSNMAEAENMAPQRFITCLVLPSAFGDRHSSNMVSSPPIPLIDNDDGIRGDPTIVNSSDLVTSPPAPLADNDGNSGVPAISRPSPQLDSDYLPGPEPELDAVSDTTKHGSELETLLPPPVSFRYPLIVPATGDTQPPKLKHPNSLYLIRLPIKILPNLTSHPTGRTRISHNLMKTPRSSSANPTAVQAGSDPRIWSVVPSACVGTTITVLGRTVSMSEFGPARTAITSLPPL